MMRGGQEKGLLCFSQWLCDHIGEGEQLRLEISFGGQFWRDIRVREEVRQSGLTRTLDGCLHGCIWWRREASRSLAEGQELSRRMLVRPWPKAVMTEGVFWQPSSSTSPVLNRRTELETS